MYKGILRSLLAVLFFVVFNANAQQIQPQGQFLNDTIKIGVPIGYSLSLKYPKDMDVVFPDSLYDFSPYEIESKKFFPTKSDSTHSYDSAVYYLSSFEIDSIQTLKLPVFIIHGNDSTPVYSKEDQVILEQLVSELPDSTQIEALPLIENTTYKHVPLAFNYPYLIVGAVLLFIVFILIQVFFGDKIKNKMKLRRLKKSNLKFLKEYDSIVTNNDLKEKQKATSAINLWKDYMESLEKRPYTQLTTKEIVELYKSDEIATPLRTLDRIMYGGKLSSEQATLEQYTMLKKHTLNRYHIKVEEVKHG